MNPRRRIRLVTLRALRHRIFTLLRSRLFVMLTLWGNGCVLVGATTFHWVEHSVNPRINSFLDSLAWAVGTVTTVGYAEVFPVTNSGKIITIFMMIGGSLFLWSYMAFFVSALIGPELDSVETELRGVESDISKLKKDIQLDEVTVRQLKKLIGEIQVTLDGADKSKNSLRDSS